MLDSFTNSLVLMLMIALGYFLKTKGIIGPQHRKLFLTLILNVTMPCAIIAGFDMDLRLGTLLAPFLIGCGACLALNCLALFFTRKEPGQTRALTLLMTCGFLVAPFTLPFAQANLPAAVMGIAAFDIAQGFFNMGFNYATATVLISGKREGGFSLWFVLKSMLRSGPLLAYFALLLLSSLRIPLPGLVLEFAKKVGGATTFLSMTFIGLVLDVHLERDMLRQLWRILAIRYGCALAVSLLCFFVLPIDPVFAKAVTLGVLTPVSSASMAYADKFGCDAKVYGAASSMSFLIGVAVFAALFILWA